MVRAANNKNKSGIINILIVIIVLAALGAAGYYYQQNKAIKKNPQKITEQEVSDLKQKIGRLMLLPDGEEPQLATVSDAAKLKTEQQFFVAAENGDKLLIYQTAQKAILYRPSIDKIVEVGPVTFENSETPIPTLTTTPRPKS